MTPANRNRLIAVVALLAAGAGLGVVAFGNMGENLVYYWSPSEMVAQGERAYDATIRLGGVVEKGSLDWNAEHTQLAFRVSDNKEPGSPSVKVISREVPPQMFREGIGVVVEGTYDKGGVFTSNRLMVNHSNEYRPPKPGDKPHDWKETVSSEQTASAVPARKE
jgi:cytochrome c-type biogenesis protein CcmE